MGISSSLLGTAAQNAASGGFKIGLGPLSFGYNG